MTPHMEYQMTTQADLVELRRRVADPVAWKIGTLKCGCIMQHVAEIRLGKYSFWNDLDDDDPIACALANELPLDWEPAHMDRDEAEALGPVGFIAEWQDCHEHAEVLLLIDAAIDSAIRGTK